MIWGLYNELLNELKSTAPPTSDREDALVDFTTTPYYAERVLSFGTLLALDSFLHTLAIQPLRAMYGLWNGSDRADAIQFAIIACSFRVLQGVNTSKVYHGIRSQAGITMFVLYSLMDVCDKFLCSVGHEIAACLTSRRTLESRRRTLIYAIVNFVYVVTHSFVLMWQLVTLNLAVNSYSNALLSFMLTNQFGEIKSAVFKRFDQHSLFQLTCADITQRFQFASLLLVIVLRNVMEQYAKGKSLFAQSTISKIAGPASLVMGATIVVDWLKIAYIVNFNNLSSKTLFSSYLKLLRDDYANDAHRGHQSLVSKQAGFPVAPLVIVCVRMFAQGGVIVSPLTPPLFIVLLLLKLRLGSWLYQTTSTITPATDAEPPTQGVEKAKPAGDLEKNDLEKNDKPQDTKRSIVEDAAQNSSTLAPEDSKFEPHFIES